MTRLCSLVILTMLGAACAQSPTSPSTSMVPAVSAGGGGAYTTLSIPPIPVIPGISCPSDAPTLNVGTFDLRVDLLWTQVGAVNRYEVEIQRFEVTNAWVTVEIAVVNSAGMNWYGREGSRYRARVRSASSNCDPGKWSPYIQFSIAGAPPLPSAPVVPLPPPPPHHHPKPHHRR